MRNLY
ncbi:immunogenic domain protein, partial [Vibrio parahaemolyticus V-223/04]